MLLTHLPEMETGSFWKHLSPGVLVCSGACVWYFLMEFKKKGGGEFWDGSRFPVLGSGGPIGLLQHLS